MQPIVAVPSFICADAFNKFLPFATGFAAGCMIWMVVAEVLPDAFKVICRTGHLKKTKNEKFKTWLVVSF